MGGSYIGANFSKLCADGTESWLATWGSYAELLTHALSISSQISDTNYIQIGHRMYRHQRHFRLIVTTNVNSQVLITKNITIIIVLLHILQSLNYHIMIYRGLIMLVQTILLEFILIILVEIYKVFQLYVHGFNQFLFLKIHLP